MEAREIERDVSTLDDNLVVDRFKKGDPLYDMPAADRYCKEHGLNMADMTEEEWKTFIFGYHD